MIVLFIVYGVSSNISVDRQAKSFALDRAKSPPPVPIGFVMSSIEKIERSIEDDANIIIYTDPFLFTYTKNDSYKVVRSNTSDANMVIVRDKTKIIESKLYTDMVLKFEARAHDLEDGIVDLTSQYSKIIFESKDGVLIAQTQPFTIDVSEKQSLIEFPDMRSIVTVGDTIDCMPRNDQVCHPELHFETGLVQDRYTETLERGDNFSAISPSMSEMYLTDAHTYDYYKNDHLSDYMRAELFIIFDEVDQDEFEANISYGDRYCNMVFDSSLQNTITSCGTRSVINKFFIWIGSLIVDEDDGYKVC